MAPLAAAMLALVLACGGRVEHRRRGRRRRRTGRPTSPGDDDDLRTLGTLTGSDFEAVDGSSLMVDLDSARARG
jgi:hypothetical protein